MELYVDVSTVDITKYQDILERNKTFLKCKRVFDFLISFVLLTLFSPLMLVIGLIVKFTSKGPVLYRELRVGQFGREFFIYKFRSMVNDDNDPDYQRYKYEVKNGTFIKNEFNPRITKFGKILRKSSIDELPQLYNVLIGEMSLVGPRPSASTLSGTEFQKNIRTIVKPGMTGLWQVRNRGFSHITEMIDYDIKYIENMSPKLDIYVLLKTIPTVISCKGAF